MYLSVPDRNRISQACANIVKKTLFQMGTLNNCRPRDGALCAKTKVVEVTTVTILIQTQSEQGNVGHPRTVKVVETGNKKGLQWDEHRKPLSTHIWLRFPPIL